jgi:hypothetical protein
MQMMQARARAASSAVAMGEVEGGYLGKSKLAQLEEEVLCLNSF